MLLPRERRFRAAPSRPASISQPKAFVRRKLPNHVRRLVWERDGGICTICGRSEQLQYGHLIAVSRGGSDTPANVFLECQPCNLKRGVSLCDS